MSVTPGVKVMGSQILSTTHRKDILCKGNNMNESKKMDSNLPYLRN